MLLFRAIRQVEPPTRVSVSEPFQVLTIAILL